jgi:hypothetical protein
MFGGQKGMPGIRDRRRGEGEDRGRRKQTGRRIGRCRSGDGDLNVWYTRKMVTAELESRGLARMQDTLTSCVECEGAAARRLGIGLDSWGIGRLAAKRSTSALDLVVTITADSLSGDAIGAHRMAWLPCGKRQSHRCPRQAGNTMSWERRQREKLHRRMAWKDDHHHLSPPRKKTPCRNSPLRGTSLRAYSMQVTCRSYTETWYGDSSY